MKNTNTIIGRIGRVGRIALAGIGLAGALAFPVELQAQTIAPRTMTLLSAQPCTNGTTSTFNVGTNFLHGFAGTHQPQFCAIIAPTAPNAPTNGNFCTNLVLTCDFLIGTNLTTDNEFVWTINSPAMTSTPFTNPIVVKTNLTLNQMDSVTGIQVRTALGASTNAVGFKLTLLVNQVP